MTVMRDCLIFEKREKKILCRENCQFQDSAFWLTWQEFLLALPFFFLWCFSFSAFFFGFFLHLNDLQASTRLCIPTGATHKPPCASRVWGNTLWVPPEPSGGLCHRTQVWAGAVWEGFGSNTHPKWDCCCHQVHWEGSSQQWSPSFGWAWGLHHEDHATSKHH